MTQQEKEILIKDLCARLPYGVKISIPDLWTHKEEIETLDEIFKGDDGIYRVNSSGMCLEYVKPYLFPLSNMTEEQKEEFNNILSSVGLCYAYDADNSIIIFSNSNYNKNNYISDFDKIEVWLNKNHFDYSGLIPMGLAKNATNLNIY
jgi:hypothetical protein